MRTCCLLLLGILLCFVEVRQLYSQANPITLNPIPVADQFPSKSVQRIMQDSEGFLWFGTADGLCRYDGYRMWVFRSDFNNPDLLPNNEITCLAEDNENNIWIGTKEGVSILNRQTFRITPFQDPEIRNSNVQALLCDSKGKVWIGMDGHIFRHDPTNKITEELKDVEPGGGINYIYEDHLGKTWILTWGGGVFEYKKDGIIIKYPRVGQKNVPFRIYQDDKDQYWLCTWGDGVYQFNPDRKDSIYKKHLIVNHDRGTEENAFFSIVQDNANRYIWLMSFSGMYALQCGEAGAVKQVDVSYLFRETNNIFSEIIKDREGNLWIGAYDEGAFSINFNKPVIHNLALPDIHRRVGVVPNITSVYKDTDSVLWLNQNRTGLVLYDIKTDKVKTYKEFPAFRSVSFMGNISCFENGGDNEIWLGAMNEGKIGIAGKREGEPFLKKIIDLNKIIPETSVRKIFRDSKQNLWISGMRHVFFKPSGSEDIIVFPGNLSHVTDIAEDSDGYVWMSSSRNGLYRIPPGFSSKSPEVKIDNYNKDTCELISNNVLAVCCDHRGNVWFGLKDGSIILHDMRKFTFEDYTQEFNMNGETIQDMFADHKNNIWVSTNKRVIGYNKTMGSSRDYSVYDGLIVNSFRAGSYYSDVKNEMLYFGGNKGICIFSSPVFTVKESPSSNVMISDVKLNGQSLLSTPGNIKFRTISQELILSPNERNIELDFTALNYTYPGKIIYAYKMDGVDNDWIYTNRQFATYNQLKKGNHIFYVKATDENRVWHSDVTSFDIYKTPAFYETWWAYILYVMIAVSIFYWIYRVIKNRIQLRQELRIAQIEKDKSEELIQVKLKYFTNVSHDLLTPLTVISCLIDDLETVLKPKVRQFAMMRANINRLRRLLQQVLDFRKVESGNMKLRVTHGDITVFIKDMYVNNFIPLFEKKKIRFVFKSEPASISGYFDVDKVDKIIYNLLSNALKYTPDGGTVEVKLDEIEQGKIVSIIVSDSGIGIPPEHMDDIFVRFYNNKDIDSGQTNGIGLSLTRELVELHHGKISVESKLNEGSAFKVVIPLDKSAFGEKEIDDCLSNITNTLGYENDGDEPVEWTETEDILKKENFNLLLVEDNLDILQTVKSLLEKRYNVLAATDGEMALDLVNNHDVDLIISDVMMPRMDGLELCKTIKTDINTSHIPVLLLTAKSSVEDRIDCYDAGADGYISKPFDMKLLVARINNFRTNKKKRQADFKSNAEINISVLEYPSLDETFLNKAVAVIEEHLADTDFDMEVFTEKMNMSKSTLYRKIKTMTDLSPNDFIRNIRLKHACQMLRNPSISISEVAYATGFSDQRYFSKCFKAEFAVTPTGYQKDQVTP